MNHHPEQRDGEIYMGNATLGDVRKSSWRTSRFGTTPLMADGSAFKYETELRPWFIEASEVEQVIRHEADRKGPNWQEKVRRLTPMLEQRTAFVQETIPRADVA